MSKNDRTQYPWLQVWPQSSEHSPATIRGNTIALTVLRDAINAAISIGESEAKVMATDGEGYGVIVQRCDVLSSLGSPYYISQHMTQLAYEIKHACLPDKPSIVRQNNKERCDCCGQ